MRVSPVCPRCGEPLVVRPGSAAQAWCHVHGAVTPLHHTVLIAHDAISAVPADPGVPAWVPDPMPTGWSVTGLAWGGEPGARAIVVDCAGPAPLGGSAELVLVAEEPGTGGGCGYAGPPRLGRRQSRRAASTAVGDPDHRRPGRLRRRGLRRLALAGHVSDERRLAA